MGLVMLVVRFKAMRLISVNELLQDAESFMNSDVFLHWVLAYNEGCVLIQHWPKSERGQDSFAEIWVYTGDGVFSFNSEVLKRINGKRVVVHGVVSLKPSFTLSDPGSFWSVHIRAIELTEQKLWSDRHEPEQNG